jgi:GNAT superfamily N-acetyltransferase
MGEVSIRQAAAADAQAIHELHGGSVRTLCASFYRPDVIEGWLKGRTPSGYLNGIASGGTFVAEADCKIVGFCEATPGEIVAVFVDPRWGGRGVGAALLTRALDVAEASGRAVRLESTLNAAGFYERFGFRIVGRSSVRRNDVDVPVVIMERHAG